MKKGAVIATISALLVVSVGVYVSVKRESIQNKILNAVIKKISSSLPFKIESYQLSKKLDHLQINLRWNTHTVVLAGDLKMKWHGNANGWTVDYLPEVQIDQATPIHLKLHLEAPTDFDAVKNATLVSDSDRPDAAFVWKEVGADAKKLLLNFSYGDGIGINAELSADSMMWTDPADRQHAVNAQTTKFQASLKGDLLSAKIDSKGAEVLWGDFYSDIPLSDLPLSVSTLDRKNFAVELGAKKELTLQVKVEEAKNQPIEITWKTSRVGFTPIAQWLIKAIPPAISPLQNWSDLEIKGGTLLTQGSASFQPSTESYQIHEATVEASNLSFRSLSHSVMAKKVSFSLPYRAKDASHRLTLEVGEAYFKKLPLRLQKTQVVWSDSTIKTERSLPLEIQNLSMQIGQVQANLIKSENSNYQATTSLKMQSGDLKFLNRAFCLPADRFPPASLNVDFSTIKFSPGVIEPRGKIEVGLFKGKIELNEVGLYDLGSEVPETDFDVEWKDIDLQQMGEWSKFGEIKGTLEGYAHEVTLLSALPTHYDFFVRVMPLDRSKKRGFVEFSPDAMKNFVKIFTGEDLDEQIPGIAGWLMFGWPSRVFGGYDVQYAGISLQSSDGLIKVETLDPPDVVSQTRKHFILYGPRFKMPIGSTMYPLVLDATAMSNFVHQMATRFGSLKGESDEIDENKKCSPPEL
jgi:hypothetical protein